ncbi:dTDP-4-dehydrorhamnose reductase [Pseudomarimonas salicorniae]|uniref:dTDP-4-dehydrorhamnose reductase n=1 Tax=Pseudomarimonas salicorniae TaxID=2933270 RepID=A0ABT0GHW7_9GAMM|nr:dTDP-4-dehydrorhamnose reductase [Lysobacter sp. CAU 1642]MCK7594028.1 dTDP-4-dehydrorhamnose reductase [Lysobacter sp. CAU 1642]
MKILLTGVDGQVGFELHRALAPLGRIVASSRSGALSGGGQAHGLDLSSAEAISATLDSLEPQVVVNPAAYTAVDRSESEPEQAHQVNARAPAVMADWCARRGALLIHYSTDYVFNGESDRPWREHDPTGPLGVYGASKLAGEEAIRASGCRHLILRTAWVYSSRFANFLKTMLRLGAERDELGVVSDQIGAPTTARGLAEVSAALLARIDSLDGERLGTFHCVHAGQTSWHGFAEAIFARAVESGLLPRAPLVRPIGTVDYPTPARRPPYSVLDCSRLREVHGLSLPEWQDGLDCVIGELAAR